tara:strand:- start:510 stop:1805 length:1296 start_codon:yes stop_codon:yes gene_type:complete
MKITTFLLIFTVSYFSFSQTNVDFEASGTGTDWNWVMDQNGPNPPLEFVANPNTTSVNTSETTAKFIATAEGQSYALTYTDDMGSFTFGSNNSIVKMMVLKTFSSVVALKFEDSTNPAFFTIVEVANSVTNGDWEELTFNFGTSVGNTYDRMVVIPDFIDRADDKTIFFDQISFNVNDTLEDYNLEDIDFESSGYGANWVWTTDNNYTDPVLEMVSNPSTNGLNSSSTVAKFISTTAGDPWALTYTDNIGSFTFTEANSTVTIMVRKSKLSDVGLKFEGPNPDGSGGVIFKEVKVANTLTNGNWEQLTFDFSSEIGTTFDRFVVIPDFDDSRFQDHITYFDEISFGNQTAGLNEFDLNSIKFHPNPANKFINFSSLLNSNISVVIYDMLGKEVLRSEHVQSQLDISILKPGMYLLNFIQGINTQTKKLLVN